MSQVPVTKSGHIRDSLHGDIKAGVWKPGDRLPSVRYLAQQFDVTVVTISKALGELEQASIVQREHGRGTFVCEPTDAMPPVVGALMPTHGHAFDHLFSAIVRELGGQGLDVLPTHTPPAGSDEGALSLASLERVLSRDLRAVLVDGSVEFPFSALDGHPELPVTFVHRYECELPCRAANRILTNYRMAGAIAAEHLLASGAQKLLLLTISEHYAKRDMPYGGVGITHEFEGGILDALGEAGRDPQQSYHRVWDGSEETDSQVLAALRNGVDGVICMGDHRALRVYDAARQLGRTVGDDLLVIGCYDTPWCQALTPKLSSVSIQQDRMASRIAQALAEDWRAELCWIPPTVVPRESSP